MSTTNQPTKPTAQTKMTPYALTKRMNENLIKDSQKTEQQKKTEQKILYILSYVNKKEVKKFKTDYIKFIVRYQPKTKHEDILKMCSQVRSDFENMRFYLLKLKSA